MKKRTRAPGSPVRGSTTGRPLMAAFDLFGRRGTLRVVWELREGDAFTFRALATASALPPATLNARLREMRELGLIDAEEGYRLTALGREMLQALAPLDAWAKRWARTLSSRA